MGVEAAIEGEQALTAMMAFSVICREEGVHPLVIDPQWEGLGVGREEGEGHGGREGRHEDLLHL